MLKKLFSRQFYRSSIFWLLSLLALYSVLGFVVLPKVIHNTISEQVTANLGWKTEIKKVEFNPFLMTLSIDQLAISDNEKETIAFTRFHADFELRSVTEGAFTFKNIALVEPSFHLSINADGSNNIQQALAAHPQPVQAVDPDAEQDDSVSVMPKLLFDNISVENGSLSANDLSQGDLIQHQLNPISFTLQNFSTYVEKGGDYQLSISLGDNQSIDWKGNIAVAPIASQGAFSIKGIKLARFWPYVEAFSPYQLRHSSTDLKANYSFSYIDASPQLQLDDAYVTLNEVQLADKQKPDAFLNIKQIQVGPTAFDLAKQSVVIKQLAIDTLDLDVIRARDGQIEFLAPLDTFLANSAASSESQPVQTEQTQSAATSPHSETVETAPFQWSIEQITVNDSNVQVTDNFVAGGASIGVHDINAELLTLNQSLSNTQPFTLSYQIESSAVNSVTGELVAQPFALNSDIQIAALPLNIIQPYIAEIAHVELKSGALSIDASSVLTTHPTEGLQGTFKGDIDISNFETFDTLNKHRLLGWERLSISPLDLNLAPLSIDIEKIALDKLYSRLVITEDREINLAQLLIEQTDPQPQAEPASGPAASINIDEITLNEGGAYFADLSLRPQFSTGIQHLTGTIKGISSNNLESADVDIHGRIEEYGSVAIMGEINPLAGDLSTDINVNFDKIELTTMTPYSGRYAGYVIDKGKLSLALNYKIANGILDGSNRLILDQFELGASVASEEAVNLPLKLALALFKDSNGIIDLSLPTKGDINSPDFEIGGIVMKALLNVITKAITSPFSLLANLAGGDEDALQSVSFALGSANLDSEQKTNLKTLAKLLIERPQLVLEIRANVDSEQELRLLKEQRLTSVLALEGKDEQQQLSAMEGLLTEQQGPEAVQTLKNQLLTAQDEQQKVDEAIFVEQYRAVLFDHLVALQPITSLQLSELAQQRIGAIKNELIMVNKVDSKQIFALRPVLTGSAEDDVIKTIFSLTSQ